MVFFYVLNITKFLALISLFVVTLSHAKQVSFKKLAHEHSHSFHYQWLDSTDQRQSFQINLMNDVLFSQFRHFRSYDAKSVQNEVQRKIRKQLKKTPFDQVRVRFSRQQGSFTLTSNNEQALAQAEEQLAQWQHNYLKEYLDDNYYHQFKTHQQNIGIKPDHVRIASESVNSFKPLREPIIEVVGVKDVREVSNYILSMIQSIPYSTLTSRVESSGAGFNIPNKVLWENQGDCDSKMVLTAAMMRAIMPRIDLVFIYLDNHALLGIGIEPKGDEKFIEVNEHIYVLADPTGPRLMNIGELSFESEQAIKANLYSAEAFTKTDVEQLPISAVSIEEEPVIKTPPETKLN